jgi:ADP-ribosyl-[dinitrogen reductase] hydrolase
MTQPPSSSAPANQARERAIGALLGLAVGDAVGTTLEFKPRTAVKPISDMVGGGPFGLKPGQWTDDTSMALCLGHSLLECRGFDPGDQMRKYVAWRDSGYMSSTGAYFDIGNATNAALGRFQRTGNPVAGSVDPGSAGNGSIMRLAPVPILYHRDLDAATRLAVESSRTTHGAPECLESSAFLSRALVRAIRGAPKEVILFGDDRPYHEPSVRAIAAGQYRSLVVGQIRGTGYVIDCLSAALWCFMRADSYEAAVLQAANLGDDADTTAAVCGQLAGAFYGRAGIPIRWRERVFMGAEIQRLAGDLFDMGETL